MQNEVIHRKSCHRHTLCGIVSINKSMTIIDSEVTCLDCQMKLDEILMSDTKTTIINKFKRKIILKDVNA